MDEQINKYSQIINYFRKLDEQQPEQIQVFIL